MNNWKLTDAWEFGLEYTCMACGKAIDVKSKNLLPQDCPYCGYPKEEDNEAKDWHNEVCQ